MTPRTKNKLLDSLRASEEAISETPVRYSLAGVTVATPGNLCVIAAHAKVGKSALVGAFLAAASGRSGDTLGVGSCNQEEGAVIHFDTEQSLGDHRNLVATGLRRVQLPDRPAWLRSYRVAEVPIADRLGLLEYEVKRAAKAHGSVHSVLVDGVADFVVNPNHSEKAFALVGRLHQMAAQFETSVVCVLHLNPGQSKTRGHLGSQLERKAETNILIEKDHGVSTVYTHSARHTALRKVNGHSFCWNDDAGMHLTWKWQWKP